MKKIISVLLVFTLLLGCVFMLSSCNKDDDKDDKKEEKGQLSGTYVYTRAEVEYTYEISYTFVGNKVTSQMKVGTSTQTKEATYVINESGDTITFTAVEDGESKSFDCEFENGDGYIIIDGYKYIKQ